MTDIVLPQVVFTDLDGTLLDLDTYSFAPALPAVQALLNRGVPIVFCSAKTRPEQEVYRQQMMTRDPFIVENGGCIFIPEGYFPFECQYDRVVDGYILIELGTPYREIREALKRLKAEKGVNLRGFGDMSVEEVAAITGLDLEMARRARQREYSETLTEVNGPLKVEQALEALTEVGLNWTHGGRF
ncbi:MAG: HAD hydrolase family protein, partial [Dehalococcoidia bacterium]|nr:HAD hydrolase family protein [Dehalococcoidia bacterium]